MPDAQQFNVFELDDHPHDHEFTLKTLRRFYARNNSFKANLFCVPGLMTKERIAEIADLPFIRMYPHGFRHRNRECHDLNDDKLAVLDAIAASPQWGKVFKAPRYGYTSAFLNALNERGFSVCMNTLNCIDDIPHGLLSWERRAHEIGSADKWQFMHRHCRYPDGFAFGQAVVAGHRSSLSSRFNLRYKHFLKSGAGGRPFAFCEDLLQPAMIKVNAGCGPHYFQDWLNLDHRGDGVNVQKWAYPSPIPVAANRAEVVYTSHFLNYIADHSQFFLDVWRVLRPGGVYRLEEDNADAGWQWRPIGKRHITGRILSHPSKRAIFETLERVGFTVREVSPTETGSKAPEVTLLHTRNSKLLKGYKFVAEAVKDIKIRNLNRAYLDDWRAPRNNDYPYSLIRKGHENDTACVPQDIREEGC